MALFRRRRAVPAYDAGPAAARFWHWWADAAGHVADALDQGDRAAVATLLAPHVHGIDPDLTWHTGPGVRSRRMLVLSGARHPALRVVTERWRRAGPPDSPGWEYHPAMPPGPVVTGVASTVGVDDVEAAAASAEIERDDVRYRLDVEVHHPEFARLDSVSRHRVANLLVTHTLGEDDTDRWIGRISAADAPAPAPLPLALLGRVVAAAAGTWRTERWVRVEGSFDSERLVADVRHPLHRVDHPLFDEHLAVRLPYAGVRADGLPTAAAAEGLAELQRALVDRLGPDAVLVAVQTAGGERVLHLYADSTASPEASIRSTLDAQGAATASLEAQWDPGWDAVEHLRVAATPY